MSGFTSSQILNALDELRVDDICRMTYCGVRTQLSNKKYNLVFLMIGTNDIGTGVTIEKLTENILLLKDVCLQYCPKLVLFTIPSSREGYTIQAMNERIKEIINPNSNIYLFDCYSLFNKKYQEAIANGTYCDLFDHDGLHFSEGGSKLLGEAIFSQLGDYGIDTTNFIRK